MERVHAQRQMADVGKLVQASATVVADNDLRHAAVVAAKAKPRLGGQLQGAAGEVADDVLMAHQHDVPAQIVTIVHRGRDALCTLRKHRRRFQQQQARWLARRHVWQTWPCDPSRDGLREG
jgi:adenylosuccinate lyase